MGAGQLFQELVWLQFKGKQKERNKEVEIPRAKILDMLWDCAKEQNCRGGETTARASQSVFRESVGLMVYTRWEHRDGLAGHPPGASAFAVRQGKTCQPCPGVVSEKKPWKTQSRQFLKHFKTTEPFFQVNHVTAASQA